MQLAMDGRSDGYTRGAVRKDILYNFIRFREFSAILSKKNLCATQITDGVADKLLSEGMISPAAHDASKQALMDSLRQIDLLDNLNAEDLYRHIHNVRKAVLGTEVLDALQEKQACASVPFLPDGIDQSAKKQALLKEYPAVIFAITQAELFAQMALDIQAAQQAGILVQAVKVNKAAGAQILSCEKGVTTRQMFRQLDLPPVPTDSGIQSSQSCEAPPHCHRLHRKRRAGGAGILRPHMAFHRR